MDKIDCNICIGVVRSLGLTTPPDSNTDNVVRTHDCADCTLKAMTNQQYNRYIRRIPMNWGITISLWSKRKFNGRLYMNYDIEEQRGIIKYAIRMVQSEIKFNYCLHYELNNQGLVHTHGIFLDLTTIQMEKIARFLNRKLGLRNVLYKVCCDFKGNPDEGWVEYINKENALQYNSSKDLLLPGRENIIEQLKLNI